MTKRNQKMNNGIKRLKKIKIMSRFFKYTRPYRNIFILVFALAVLDTLFSLVPIYMMKPLTDRVFAPAVPTPTDERLWVLNMLIVVLVVVYVLELINSSVLEYKKDWLGIKIGLDLRKAIYTHLQKLSLKFYNLERVGNLHSRVCYDTRSLEYFIVSDFLELVKSTVMFLVIGCILFYLNRILALILLVPIPIIIYVSRTFGERLIISYRKVYQKMANMSSLVFNAIKGAIVVKTNAAEEREIARFDIINSDLSNERLQCSRLRFLFSPSIGIILFISGIMVRWYGGWQVVKGDLSLGDMMVFIGYLWQFYNPIRGINSIYGRYQDVAAAAERFFKILDTEPEVYDTSDAIVLPQLKGNVRFDNTVFRYNGKNVLENINLEVQSGEVIGITGPSGGGKTSLIHLLCRLYTPCSGSIYIDGYNVQDLELESLHSQIGIVLQDTFLFYGTIAENIAYAKPDASRIEIIVAARAAGAHDFIMRLPDAYDTLLGEGGVGLSTGERQRISIARVLLKNSRIIIFDEATSSVDLLTESIIESTIKKLKEEHRTVFLISHKLSMMEIADRIIFLDDGKIVESGTYEGLSKAGGAFAHFLKEKQLEHDRERSLDFYVL